LIFKTAPSSQQSNRQTSLQEKALLHSTLFIEVTSIDQIYSKDQCVDLLLVLVMHYRILSEGEREGG
jgi:hypothetical protein